jgi:hypothetical protein
MNIRNVQASEYTLYRPLSREDDKVRLHTMCGVADFLQQPAKKVRQISSPDSLYRFFLPVSVPTKIFWSKGRVSLENDGNIY